MKLIGCMVLTIITLFACKNQAPNLATDHINIWVKDPIQAKEKLAEIGFDAVPDSLSTIHTGQGTTGRYFYFLNGYLELIYVYDEKEFIENATTNASLDFIERSKSPENGYLPFSVALQMKDYDKTKIPFKTVAYHQDWMKENDNIYAAENSKTKKEEPSIFVIYPEMEYDKFEHMDSLVNIPEEYAIWRSFYKHRNGAEKISKIKIYTTQVNKDSKTIKCLNAIENVEVKEGMEYLMELYFDEQKQQKTYDLRPEIPLKIYL